MQPWVCLQDLEHTHTWPQDMQLATGVWVGLLLQDQLPRDLLPDKELHWKRKGLLEYSLPGHKFNLILSAIKIEACSSTVY